MNHRINERKARVNILDDAKYATRDRPGQYGHPREHFAKTVALFNAKFAEYLRKPLLPQDWPIVMILDKVARHGFVGQRDSLVDIAGYARTIEMLSEKPLKFSDKILKKRLTGEPI